MEYICGLVILILLVVIMMEWIFFGNNLRNLILFLFKLKLVLIIRIILLIFLRIDWVCDLKLMLLMFGVFINWKFFGKLEFLCWILINLSLEFYVFNWVIDMVFVFIFLIILFERCVLINDGIVFVIDIW